MRNSNFSATLYRGARHAIACCALLPLSLAALGTDSRLLQLTKDLPWEFSVEKTGKERNDLLPGAANMDNATLRTVQAVHTGASGEPMRIEYTSASYSNSSTASRDYETLIARIDLAEDLGREWNIVLQAQNDLYWLQSKCAPSQPYVRQAYANLISYVEATGVTANRALLCDCDAQCKKIAVDR